MTIARWIATTGASEVANRDSPSTAAEYREAARHKLVKAATEVPDDARHELQDPPRSAPEAARPLHRRATEVRKVATGSQQEDLLQGMDNTATIQLAKCFEVVKTW